jgi:hypothetical protein
LRELQLKVRSYKHELASKRKARREARGRGKRIAKMNEAVERQLDERNAQLILGIQ